MPRLFTCVWIPKEIKDKILNLQKEMQNLPLKCKFVELENLHITITFIGDVRDGEVEKLKNKLDRTLKDIKKFHVNLEGLRVIPNENYIRVMGVEIRDEKNLLAELIKKVGNEIGGKYYEKQKVTLCRVKNVFDKGKIAEFIEKNRDIKIGLLDVDKVALVKSVLTRNGPVYETIHETPLK